MTWEHKPNRIPDLDYDDLKTIEWLIRNHGERDIPIFSKNLYAKVKESLGVYEWEKQLHHKAMLSYERDRQKFEREKQLKKESKE